MISAIILAAGRSTRMGQPKMLLPWGHTTVLGQVIECVQRAEIQDILVITGSMQDEVEKVASAYNVQTTQNVSFESKEMLSSIQCGLREQKAEVQSTLICLGDQPQVEERNVRRVCEAFFKSKSHLVVPSYHMRRGHPWLVARPLWGELLNMQSPRSPRDFLNAHAKEIEYVVVDTSSVIEDIDAPEDYLKFKPSL
jgi:molybdenum cofactor cytidylyltransferase